MIKNKKQIIEYFKSGIKKTKDFKIGIEHEKFLFSNIDNKRIDYSKVKTGKIFNISDKSVALIIKKYAALSGLDADRYGGHSLRSGFATSTAESGAEERNIMAMTGHKTTQMVRRYIQEANLFKNNALNKIKI